jgi:type IV secretory pathway TrbD component
MSNNVTCHRVYRSINKPLLIWGVERRLFFLALVMGAATFNFFGSLLSGLLMFAALYFLARWATVTDPEALRIVLNSSKFRSRYDPAKCEHIVLRREPLFRRKRL